MSHHLVEADRLTYRYPDGTPGVTDISFRITHGESVALVGANGAGKSTLLLHVTGCLLPESGTLRVGDYPVTRQNLHEVRRSVGMIFQDPDDQLFMPTVFDDVAFGPLRHGLPEAEIAACVERSLERMGALHLRDRASHHLSDGEKRRVAIAAVLACSPDVLVMDEPTASLDPRARRQLIELLAEFTHTRLIATHDLDLALELCPRTLILKQGHLAADGPTEQLLRDDALLADCGLEKPLRLQGCPICGRKDIPIYPILKRRDGSV